MPEAVSVAAEKHREPSTAQPQMSRSSRPGTNFRVVSRRFGRQDTLHIRLIWAGLLVFFSNTIVRPLSARTVSDRYLHQSSLQPSQNDEKSRELNSQNGEHYYQRLAWHQRLRRAPEQVSVLIQDPTNPSFEVDEPNVDELNCTPRAVEQFPSNFMPTDFVIHGGVVFNMLIAVYMFIGLAIVCDSYFVPSMSKLSQALSLSHDITGATFMAIGSSVPELFTSLIGIIIAQSDVGVGAVAGSAIFNVLFIMGCCAMVPSVNLTVYWWPAFRDSLMYMVAIFVLVIVILDEKVFWYESLIMLLTYSVYIVVLVFNKPLESIASEIVFAISGYYRPAPNDEKSPLIGSEESSTSHYQNRNALEASSDHENEKKQNRSKFEYSSLDHMEKEADSSDASETSNQSTMSFPETFPRRIYWIVTLPLKIAMFLTIPDVRRRRCYRMCICTFLLSIIWIALLSYIMVWMATLAGDALDIPDTVIGFTILATGTSIPDCLASYFVTKQGHTDTAVSNSIGSNTFDILICLGLPWLIQSSIKFEDGVQIHSHGLIYSVLILLCVMFVFLGSMILHKWTLTRAQGYLFFILYIIIISIICLYEMNYFGPLNPPPCPRKI